jgi:uncharacterized protein
VATDVRVGNPPLSHVSSPVYVAMLLWLGLYLRDAVDELVKKAISAGGRHAMDPQDHGFMYGWSFYDPDGHHWEVLWMDPQVIQK